MGSTGLSVTLRLTISFRLTKTFNIVPHNKFPELLSDGGIGLQRDDLRQTEHHSERSEGKAAVVLLRMSLLKAYTLQTLVSMELEG